MEIFDYVRSVNLVDTGTNRLGTLKFIPYTPFFGSVAEPTAMSPVPLTGPGR
jgi:hypothetical protein